MNPETISTQQFRRACGTFLTGIVVATACGVEGLPHGITVNSFTSVSLDPPLILICIDHRSQFLKCCGEGQHFGINILEESQQELSQRFARKESERFAGIDWYFGKTGVPLLPLVLATMECRLTAKIIEGDHSILVGRVLFADYHEGSPLAYFRGSYRTITPPENRLKLYAQEELDWSLIIE